MYNFEHYEIQKGFGLCGTELKNAILADIKKTGLKVSARQSRGGYTDSFHFTISCKQADILDSDSVYAQGYCLNNYYLEKLHGIFTDDFLGKIMNINQIIKSYNYNHSDILTDDFDVRFFFDLRVKVQ